VKTKVGDKVASEEGVVAKEMSAAEAETEEVETGVVIIAVAAGAVEEVLDRRDNLTPIDIGVRNCELRITILNFES
jgi:hypothetical protein